jgi:hypothetical protein
MDGVDLLELMYQNAKPEAPPPPGALYRLNMDALKNICRRLYLRLSGRKADLLERIEHSWRCDNFGVRDTIRTCLGHPPMAPPVSEASGSGSSTAAGNSTGGSNSTGGGGSHAVRVTLTNGGNVIASTTHGGIHNPSNVRCVCSSRHMVSSMVRCCECSSLQHPLCVHMPPFEAGTSSFVCALCRAAWLDPFLPMIVDPQHEHAGASLAASVNPTHARYLSQFQVPGASEMQISGALSANACYMDFDLSSAHMSDLLLGKRLEVSSPFAP